MNSAAVFMAVLLVGIGVVARAEPAVVAGAVTIKDTGKATDKAATTDKASDKASASGAGAGGAKKATDKATVATKTAATLASITRPSADIGAEAPRYEAVVRGSVPVDLRRVGGAATILKKEDLQRHAYTDVHRVLAQVPGVYLRDEDGYGLRPNIGLRGASSDRSSKLTLMEDGVLFAPAPYSAPAAYYFPLMTRMEGAEIHKGAASIRYGPNTVGGAMDFVTRSTPSGVTSELDLGGGAYRTGKARGYFGASGERWGVLLEGIHLQTEGFKQLDGGGGTGFDKNEALLKLHYGTAPDAHVFQQVELRLGFADERSNETYLGLTDSDFGRAPLRRYAASQRDRMEWTRKQVQVRHVLKLGESMDLKTAAYRHVFSRGWTKLNGFRGGPQLFDLLRGAVTGENAVYAAVLAGREDSASDDQALLVGRNGRDYVSQGVQSALRFRAGREGLSHELELGARFHHDQIDRHHTEDGFRMLQGTLVPAGERTADITVNNGYTRALALHARDEITLGRVLLVPGLRAEVIRAGFVDRLTGDRSTGSATVVLPGLGAVVQLDRSFSVLAGVHQGFSPVSPGQPAGVKPEKSVNYEAGVRYKARTTKAELIGFFNDYFNLTGECTLSSGCREELLNRQYNAGAVYVGGLEASLSHEQAGPWGTQLQADLSYTLTLSSFRSSFQSDAPQFGTVREGDALPYVPVHQGAARAKLTRGPSALGLAASYVGEMREQAGQGPIPAGLRTDARLLLDVTAHHDLAAATRLYVNVDNILNTTYIAAHRPFGARPGAPRQILVGLRHQFR